MTAAVAGLCAVAVGAALVRWLRVCQREHYIAGSCLKFAGRWIRVRPLNAGVAALAAAALIGGVWSEASGRSGAVAVCSFVAVFTVIAFPWPMPLVGKPRLRFTPRAVRLSAISAAACACSVLLLLMVIGPSLSACAAGVFVPAVVDAVALLAAPIEKRLLVRFRRQAEQRLAAVAPAVIAVTGSWGKTSTKQHIRDLLGGDAAVVASPASYNNAAGLSKTINEHLVDGTEVLVAEMGMYKPGEIRELCSWIRPHIAVITSVGPMHLERAGSMERIVASKSEVLERADVAVLWVDDARLDAVAQSCRAPRLWRVGSKGGDRLDVEVDVVDDEIVVGVRGAEIGRCPADRGLHPGNVACAVAAATAYGASPGRLGVRLKLLSSPRHRSIAQHTRDRVLVIDDTFNSNPMGARAAVETLRRRVSGRRVVVTPGMVELGSEQYQANVDLAAAVVRSGATLIAVGWTNRRALREGARQSGGTVVAVRRRSEARLWVRARLGAGDGVLWENDLPDHYP